MTVIAAKKSKKPSGPYWYWTTLGPKNVNLTDRKVELPPGNYDLYWDFRGNPFDSLEFTLVDPTGSVIAKVSDTVPPGELDGWGLKPFTVASLVPAGPAFVALNATGGEEP